MINFTKVEKSNYVTMKKIAGAGDKGFQFNDNIAAQIQVIE